jgi:hypothetical protein
MDFQEAVMADPLSGVICVCTARDKSVLVASTNTGLSSDDSGTHQDYSSFTVLRVDEAQVGREFIDTIIHEFAHEYFPDLAEEVVRQFATQLTNLIYTPAIRRQGALDV